MIFIRECLGRLTPQSHADALLGAVNENKLSFSDL